MTELQEIAKALTTIEANRQRYGITFDIFPAESTPVTKAKPDLDNFDSALKRAFNGETIRLEKGYVDRSEKYEPLTFDEAVEKRLKAI